ncbi:MAG: PQQ-binding-like beta-propeller repeat protein [Acidobacteriota bacterium]|nr:PQQ-binding-like beta-propeller repeat protein [Acidobacteriota bacterium]
MDGKRTKLETGARIMEAWTMVLAVLLAGALMVALPGSATAQTPEDLFDAANAGDLAKVKQLVEAGVPVNSQDKYGTTPLTMAARNGELEIARYLVSQGADIDQKDSFYGVGPVDWAMFNEHSEVVLFLLKEGANSREGVLQMAVPQGRMELIRAAVEAGPIYASTLEELKAGDTAPPVKALLDRAESRPDPPVPTYTAEELQTFTGSFEGFAADLEAKVEVREGALYLQLGDAPATRLTVTGDKKFSGPDEAVQAQFFGRADEIEGLRVTREGQPPVGMSRAIAQPLGRAGLSEEVAKAQTAEAAAPTAPTVHWPAFRGTNARGIGDGVDTPVEWDLESGDGVRWQAEVPGLGNSSPVVWGDRVFLTTAVAEGIEQNLRTGLTGAIQDVQEEVEHRWLVLAFDKTTGKQLWETEIGRAVPLTDRHFKATQANSTPVTDGEHVVVVFPTAGLACLDMQGKVLWHHDLGGLNAGAFNDPGLEWGFAASPILYDGKAILQVDIHGGQYLAAWDLKTGKLAWRTERDVAPSWATPAIFPTPQGDQLVVNGSVIHGYDAATGKELWSLAPNSELVIATPVVGDDVVYVSAGYPPVKPIYAVPAGVRGDLEVDPRGEDPRLTWSLGIGGAYMPTPLLYRGLLYVVHHNGRLVTYDATTGNVIYKQRFSKGGTFTASPVAVNGKIYATTEEGQVYIFQAGAEYEELALHALDEPLMATPAVSEGVLLLRTPSRLIALAREAEGEASESTETDTRSR